MEIDVRKINGYVESVRERCDREFREAVRPLIEKYVAESGGYKPVAVRADWLAHNGSASGSRRLRIPSVLGGITVSVV